MGETVVTVIVADDHQPVHNVVRRILEPDYRVVRTVLDGKQLVDAVRETRPALIVADVSMPEMSGIEALRQLTSSGEAPPPTVFVSAHSEPRLIADALAAGGRGFVSKARAPFDLKPAIAAALEGRRFLSEGLVGPDPEPAE